MTEKGTRVHTIIDIVESYARKENIYAAEIDKIYDQIIECHYGDLPSIIQIALEQRVFGEQGIPFGWKGKGELAS